MAEDLDAAVEARLRQMAGAEIVPRILWGDHTVWKDDPTEIADRLGWLRVAGDMRERVEELEEFAKLASDDSDEVILLGMGGSSLAAEVLSRTVGIPRLPLSVLDTTHPVTIAATEARLDLDRTLFLVASKSGTTVETRSHLARFWDLTGGDGSRFVAITDPGTPLDELASERGFRAVFRNPEDVGGRYSALSLFGLVPRALLGAPVGELIDEAQRMAAACWREDPEQNPGARLGARLGEAALRGQDKLTLVLPGPLRPLGDWIEQLVAESTGKEGQGIVPVVGEDLGPPEVYGPDRIFVAYGEHEGLDALEAAGHPVVRLEGTDLGGQLFLWEFATAIAGHVLGINPFDQPNVAQAKEATARILEEGFEDPGFDELPLLLSEVRPGDYLAIQAYLDPVPETRAALQRVRLALRDRFSVATTVGFGPRYLHSTGQLHKGGPNTGVFIQVVDEDRPQDASIPGEPYSFGRLIDAQALGDLRSLREGERRVARVTLDALTSEVG